MSKKAKEALIWRQSNPSQLHLLNPNDLEKVLNYLNNMPIIDFTKLSFEKYNDKKYFVDVKSLGDQMITWNHIEKKVMINIQVRT